MERYQLPPELRNVPCVEAKPWICLNETFDKPNLEGAEFDRDGKLIICRRLNPDSEVLKIDVDTKEVVSIYHEENSNLIGVAIHKDERIFLVDIKGRLPVISKEGKFLFDMMDADGLEHFVPNDLVFDCNGDIYVTDFHAGSGFAKPEGGVYKFYQETGYKTFTKLLSGMTTPNGIGFGPKDKTMWICETMTNDLIRVLMGPDHLPMDRFRAFKRAVHTSGTDMMDSLKVDEQGNVYVAMQEGGRVLIVDQDGIIIENVLQSDRGEGRCLMTPNLAIHPSRKEGYILTSGKGGSWIYKFESLAPSGHMYAFK